MGKKVKVACMLIEHDADAAAQNKFEWSPLHLALHRVPVVHLEMRKGQVDVARLFIERSVDVTAQNNNRETLLLHLASTPSYFSRMFRAKYAELVCILLKYGVDVDARKKNGLTPLRLAQQGRLAEIELILF